MIVLRRVKISTDARTNPRCHEVAVIADQVSAFLSAPVVARAILP
jgi:hypothetical protein